MSVPRKKRMAISVLLVLAVASAQARAQNWVASWTASAQGPYPVGDALAQPDLRLAFPSAELGAADQSFRMIVRPDIWGRQARIRLSNAFGARPVTFDGVFVGLQTTGGNVLTGTNRPVQFGGRNSVTVAPGRTATSDAVDLPFVTEPGDPMLLGRKLAVSFHVAGESGPMTWHAEAMTTSYLGMPGAGSLGADTGEARFPGSTTSWYFLDALDMAASDAHAIVVLGDSITDGVGSTINGDDRWPDIVSRRLHAAYGNRFSVVNEGIGGNMIVGPKDFAANPFSGGPPAVERLERDVIGVSGVSTIVWLEGINDFGNADARVEDVVTGIEAAVKRLRSRLPGVRVLMGTLTSSLNSTMGRFGAPEVDKKRQAFNDFVRNAKIFDGVVDFDTATRDPKTGELKPEFQPSSTRGGPGDRLHPNRAGYAAMGAAIDLSQVVGE